MNPRIRRVLKKREPKLVENVKRSLIVKGAKTSEVISTVLKDLVRGACTPVTLLGALLLCGTRADSGDAGFGVVCARSTC